MKTQSRKAKGRNGQKKVVAKILAAFPALSERDVISTSMGCSGVDVKLSEKAFNQFPYAIEVKVQEIHSAFIDHWIQTTDNSKSKYGGFPLMIITANRKPLLAVLKFDDFLGLHNANKV